MTILLAFHDGDDVDQRLAGHDHAGRVNAPLALQVLEPLSSVKDNLRVPVTLEHSSEVSSLFIALVGLVRDTREHHLFAHHPRWHEFGELLTHSVGKTQHARSVLEGLLGLDRAKGHDLGNPLIPVLLCHVANHLATATLIKVNVEVRHGDALGIKETLENEAVLKGVKLRDAHSECRHRPGTRSAPRAYSNAIVLGPVNEVGHHKEVAGKSHLDDDANFVIGLGLHPVGNPLRVTHSEAPSDFLLEEACLRFALWNRKAGHVVGALIKAHRGPLGNQQGVVTGLRELREKLTHLRRGLQIKLVGVKFETLGVVQR